MICHPDVEAYRLLRKRAGGSAAMAVGPNSATASDNGLNEADAFHPGFATRLSARRLSLPAAASALVAYERH